MSVDRIDVFPNYLNRDFTNLNVYKSCDDNESCVHYMFKNGSNIYKELDPFNNIPKQLEEEKFENLFSTNNIVRTNLLNDAYISSLQSKLSIDNIDTIINSILLHLRPYIFSDTTITINMINEIKSKVENTLNFNNSYMKDIKSQIKFLLMASTIQHIKNKVQEDINNDEISIKDDYIESMLKHEINNYRSRYGSDREVKKMPDEIKDVYITLLSKLNTRDIFNIISDTISKISSNIKIEQNMITNNSKLDKWDTILGDNNPQGLRQYSNIKLNNKRPQGMLFNMNY
jgi:hypothetical protein